LTVEQVRHEFFPERFFKYIDEQQNHLLCVVLATVPKLWKLDAERAKQITGTHGVCTVPYEKLFDDLSVLACNGTRRMIEVG
jgi:hypothetical protein